MSSDTGDEVEVAVHDVGQQDVPEVAPPVVPSHRRVSTTSRPRISGSSSSMMLSTRIERSGSNVSRRSACRNNLGVPMFTQQDLERERREQKLEGMREREKLRRELERAQADRVRSLQQRCLNAEETTRRVRAQVATWQDELQRFREQRRNLCLAVDAARDRWAAERDANAALVNDARRARLERDENKRRYLHEAHRLRRRIAKLEDMLGLPPTTTMSDPRHRRSAQAAQAADATGTAGSAGGAAIPGAGAAASAVAGAGSGNHLLDENARLYQAEDKYLQRISELEEQVNVLRRAQADAARQAAGLVTAPQASADAQERARAEARVKELEAQLAKREEESAWAHAFSQSLAQSVTRELAEIHSQLEAASKEVDLQSEQVSVALQAEQDSSPVHRSNSAEDQLDHGDNNGDGVDADGGDRARNRGDASDRDAKARTSETRDRRSSSLSSLLGQMNAMKSKLGSIHEQLVCEGFVSSMDSQVPEPPPALAGLVEQVRSRSSSLSSASAPTRGPWSKESIALLNKTDLEKLRALVSAELQRRQNTTRLAGGISMSSLPQDVERVLPPVS